jgi:hypothetical protein
MVVSDRRFDAFKDRASTIPRRLWVGLTRVYSSLGLVTCRGRWSCIPVPGTGRGIRCGPGPSWEPLGLALTSDAATCLSQACKPSFRLSCFLACFHAFMHARFLHRVTRSSHPLLGMHSSMQSCMHAFLLAFPPSCLHAFMPSCLHAFMQADRHASRHASMLHATPPSAAHTFSSRGTDPGG